MNGWKIGENVVGRIVEIPIKAGSPPPASPVDLGAVAATPSSDIVTVQQQISDLLSRVAALEAKVGIKGL